MDWMATAANASLISIRSRSAVLRPALARARWMAADGWDCSDVSGPATVPCAPTVASTGAPCAAAASADISTTAQAPSEICEADAAVIVPSGVKAGRSPLSASAVVSGRMPSSASKMTGSPRRCGTGTPTISLASRPSLAAAAAR